MKRLPLFILILALAGSTIFGIFKLLELRFQAGDNYPPYSSLRSDPLGTKVLHDALIETPGVSVARNYQSLKQLGGDGEPAVIFAGLSTEPWEYDDVKRLEALARGGSRVILAFLPVDRYETPHKSDTALKKATPAKKPAAGKKKDASKSEDEPEMIDLAKMIGQWGATPAYPAPQHAEGSEGKRTARAAAPGAGPDLSWHTTLCFSKPSTDWRVLYRCDGEPCILDRPFGRGSIVLAADSWFLSNEAMRAERAPRLLALILGSHTRVIFEETHLGVREQPGIATLIRKYNLGGLIAAMAVLAALFVWQSSTSFLPRKPEFEEAEIVTGKDSAAGFVSLLRRGIAPARLIEVCVNQWKLSLAHNPAKLAGTLARIESAAAQAGREPVGAYRVISQILAEKK